jgi:hypothetical protein
MPASKVVVAVLVEDFSYFSSEMISQRWNGVPLGSMTM